MAARKDWRLKRFYMEKYLKKLEELKEKYKDVSTTYKWYLKNQCDIFNDIMGLKELYEQTDEFKQYMEAKAKELVKDFVDGKDLKLGDENVFEFKNREYLKTPTKDNDIISFGPSFKKKSVQFTIENSKFDIDVWNNDKEWRIKE